MNTKRRDFIKGCATACALMVPGITCAVTSRNNDKTAVQGADLRVEKSIKAGFGGGFSVRAHGRSHGLTYAEIEHVGNRYTVVSADLIDWKIVSFQTPSRTRRALMAKGADSLTPSPLVGEGWGEGV